MRYTQFCENHRNWVYLTHFSTVFHVFGLILAGKPVGSRVRVGAEIPEGYPCICLVTWCLWAALLMALVGSGEVDEQAPAWPNYRHSLGAEGQQGRPRIVDGGGGGERERDDGHKCVTW